MLRHERAKGDTHSPFAVQLRRDGVPVNLTGKTVKFTMVNLLGGIKIPETVATVTAPATGDVEYDFQAGDVDTVAAYYDLDYNYVGFFRVYGSGEPDTYPAEDDGIQIDIFGIEADRRPDDRSVLSDTELANLARAPLRTRTVEGSVQERSMTELIEADKYLNAKNNPEAVPWGMKVARTKPPSTTSG